MTTENNEHQPLDDDKKEEHYISKSQLKREVEALQDLGVRLSKLSADTLKSFAMDEGLLDALLFFFFFLCFSQ